MRKKNIIKKRHSAYFKLAKPIAQYYAIKHGFKCERFKLKKGEGYLIMANHQTLLDPLLMSKSFNKPLYIVASDHIFNKSIPSRAMQYCFGPIKKKKATADISFIVDCVSVAKSGGNVMIYPEGNRAWADFQFFIDKSIVKLVRMLKLPLLLYNLNGGYGVNPRWGNGLRKGKFTGTIKKVFSLEEIKAMSDDELYKEIIDGLRVIDSESGNTYKSKVRAEYLERELFVCPICKKEHTLVSKGAYLNCTSCGLKVEYTEDLKLKSDNKDFKFNLLVDWYKFQLDFIKNYELKGDDDVIYKDSPIMAIDKTTTVRKVLAKGELTLTKTNLTLDKLKVSVSDITSLTVIGGTKLTINVGDKSIMLKGHERFNPIKYILMFNVLRPDIKEKYYGLDI